ncbi:MAG TPA: hypothetical protein P5543_11680, partial [Planctomycetota bacterium]|nr:hypothetical protein [Planctomycetota bacterium]
FFPLKTNAYIHEENALQIDWQDIIPKDKLHYIIGNPPFLGKTYMTKQQKQDQARLTKHKMLDYVACWYYKAAEYIQNTDIKVAFVSTSSITQGEQVGPLWTDMIEKYGLHIDFCHRSFPWDQESEETILYRERQLELAITRKQGAQKQGRQKKEKQQKQERTKKANVHCVIIGFSQTKHQKEKIIFTYIKKLTQNLENTKKYETIVTKQIANNINPYLVDAPNVIVESCVTPLYDVPKMIRGSMPVDGGNLIIEENDYEEFIKKEPKSKKFIRKLIGAEEFLYNKDRYVLWLVDATPQELQSMKSVQERLEKVKEMRLQSPSKGTQKSALSPSLFHMIRQPTTNYLAIPEVSSEKREYIPMDFIPHTTIATNLLLCIPNCPLYIFAILNSQIHNAWMRVVAGRLKSDYRYSSSVVYNNFPFPELTETQKQKRHELGQNILDTRAKYPDSNLAALYDPLTMPLPLLKAHQKLDKEVAKIYNKNWDLNNEAEIVSDLMQMYQQLLTTETTGNKNTETTETEDEETTETENKEIEDEKTTEHTELESTDKNKNTDKKQSKKTKTTKNKNTKTTENTEIDNKDTENKQTKAKTKRKIKKTDNNEIENKDIETDQSQKKEKQTKTRKTKKTDNNETETETEIYASSPMTSKRTIKKVATKATKATIKSTTIKKREKKVAKPKVAIKKATNKKATTSKANKATTTKETTLKATKTTTSKVTKIKKQ